MSKRLTFKTDLTKLNKLTDMSFSLTLNLQSYWKLSTKKFYKLKNELEMNKTDKQIATKS